jgi:hypothetical protein
LSYRYSASTSSSPWSLSPSGMDKFPFHSVLKQFFYKLHELNLETENKNASHVIY